MGLVQRGHSVMLTCPSHLRYLGYWDPRITSTADSLEQTPVHYLDIESFLERIAVGCTGKASVYLTLAEAAWSTNSLVFPQADL